MVCVQAGQVDRKRHESITMSRFRNSLIKDKKGWSKQIFFPFFFFNSTEF